MILPKGEGMGSRLWKTAGVTVMVMAAACGGGGGGGDASGGGIETPTFPTSPSNKN